MKTISHILFTVFAFALLHTPATADTLTAEEVRTLMTAKRIDWVTPDGSSKGFVRYKKNGTAAATVTAPNRFKDTGTWRIKGNQFCSTWKIIRDGKEGCSTVRTTKKDGVFRTDTVFLRAKN